MAVECADADIALAALAESGAGGAYDPGLVQEHIEEFPGVDAGLYPDIGGVFTSGACVPKRQHACPDKGGIVHIVVNQFFYLNLARI